MSFNNEIRKIVLTFNKYEVIIIKPHIPYII